MQKLPGYVEVLKMKPGNLKTVLLIALIFIFLQSLSMSWAQQEEAHTIIEEFVMLEPVLPAL